MTRGENFHAALKTHFGKFLCLPHKDLKLRLLDRANKPEVKALLTLSQDSCGKTPLLLFKLFFSRFRRNFKKIFQDSIKMSEVPRGNNCAFQQEEVFDTPSSSHLPEAISILD